MNNYFIPKEHTVCFTGHRSQKLPWRFNEQDERCIAMKSTLRHEIEKAIQQGYNTFLCGMAIGFDMICAETVLELKKNHPDTKLIGAIPCKDQDKLWSAIDKKSIGTYYIIWTEYAAYIIIISVQNVCSNAITIW